MSRPRGVMKNSRFRFPESVPKDGVKEPVSRSDFKKCFQKPVSESGFSTPDFPSLIPFFRSDVTIIPFYGFYGKRYNGLLGGISL